MFGVDSHLPSPNATVVDFAAISLREQMRIALHTDVLIMVHGGVYGATLFLPRHAIVIDVYPCAGAPSSICVQASESYPHPLEVYM